MTVSPVVETDYYGKGFEQAKHVNAMVSTKYMNFGALRTDKDRLQQALATHAIRDVSPVTPERIAWSMRPRNKKKEIGPPMRFTNRL